MDKRKWEKQKEKILSCVLGKLFPDEFSDNETDFNVLVGSYAYSVACKDLLMEYQLTPEIAAEIAMHYFIYHPKPRASIMVINRKNKVKEIVDFARDYRAKVVNFVDEIAYYCKERKSVKCIVMYNYEHKVSTYQEIMELDRLFNELAERNITLVDAIKVTGGKPIRLISYINASGYNIKKNVR